MYAAGAGRSASTRRLGHAANVCVCSSDVVCGIVVIRSQGWRRSLFFDFCPLHPEAEPRTYPVERALAQQELLLLDIPPAAVRTEGDDWPTRAGSSIRLELSSGSTAG